MHNHNELPAFLRVCAVTGSCEFCDHLDSCLANGNAIEAAADAIEELLEENRLLKTSVTLQAKIIRLMETVMKANGLPAPPREDQ